MPEYLTRDDVHMRLNNSVCMFGKKWYYIKTRDRDDDVDFHIVHGYELGKGMRNSTSIDVRDKDFDCKSPVLGYMNYNNTCYYLSRIPDRKQKQGLNIDTIISNEPRGLVFNYITTEQFRNMLMDKYPKQGACLKAVMHDEAEDLNGVCVGSAFNRNFCYRKLAGNAIGLMYKERLIALYDRDEEKFNLILSKETSFFERILEKNGVVL